MHSSRGRRNVRKFTAEVSSRGSKLSWTRPTSSPNVSPNEDPIQVPESYLTTPRPRPTVIGRGRSRGRAGSSSGRRGSLSWNSNQNAVGDLGTQSGNMERPVASGDKVELPAEIEPSAYRASMDSQVRDISVQELEESTGTAITEAVARHAAPSTSGRYDSGRSGAISCPFSSVLRSPPAYRKNKANTLVRSQENAPRACSAASIVQAENHQEIRAKLVPASSSVESSGAAPATKHKLGYSKRTRNVLVRQTDRSSPAASRQTLASARAAPVSSPAPPAPERRAFATTRRRTPSGQWILTPARTTPRGGYRRLKSNTLVRRSSANTSAVSPAPPARIAGIERAVSRDSPPSSAPGAPEPCIVAGGGRVKPARRKTTYHRLGASLPAHSGTTMPSPSTARRPTPRGTTAGTRLPAGYNRKRKNKLVRTGAGPSPRMAPGSLLRTPLGGGMQKVFRRGRRKFTLSLGDSPRTWSPRLLARRVVLGGDAYARGKKTRTLVRTGDSDPALTTPVIKPGPRGMKPDSNLTRVRGCKLKLVRRYLAASPEFKPARQLASAHLQRSLHTLRSARASPSRARSGAGTGTSILCSMFTRFGRCRIRDRCNKKHDPATVAVCTRWLQGKCTKQDCLLTHKVEPEKMSVCSYFMKGVCTAISCPYLHVNVNPAAPVCQAFLRGFCPDGLDCYKKHSAVCQPYEATGVCPNRKRCRFHHPALLGSKTNFIQTKDVVANSEREGGSIASKKRSTTKKRSRMTWMKTQATENDSESKHSRNVSESTLPTHDGNLKSSAFSTPDTHRIRGVTSSICRIPKIDYEDDGCADGGAFPSFLGIEYNSQGA